LDGGDVALVSFAWSLLFAVVLTSFFLVSSSFSFPLPFLLELCEALVNFATSCEVFRLVLRDSVLTSGASLVDDFRLLFRTI
jgi:hypothetical protein